MSIIIITPGNGTEFTTAELIINFERLDYLSTQHGDEPVPDPIIPDPIVPSAEYTIHDVYNNLYRNVPNHTTYMSKIEIWNVNKLLKALKSFMSAAGITDAEMDQLVVILADPYTTDADIEAWLETSINYDNLTLTHFKDLFSALIIIINRTNRQLLNVWFNLTLPKFTNNDKAQFFLAIDNLVAGDVITNDPYYIKLLDISEQGVAAAVTYLLPLLDVRAIDTQALSDRLENPAHSNESFIPSKIVTCHTDWTPAIGGVSTALALHGRSHMMSKVSALLSNVITKYSV